MPSNLDILNANDFGRNPFLESIVRRIRGDHTTTETVNAVVEIDSLSALSTNSADGGLDQREQKNQIEAGARIEVAEDQETFPNDTWEVDGRVWAAVGEPQGSDAGSKTIALRKVGRITGRRPNLNTQV